MSKVFKNNQHLDFEEMLVLYTIKAWYERSRDRLFPL